MIKKDVTNFLWHLFLSPIIFAWYDRYTNIFTHTRLPLKGK